MVPKELSDLPPSSVGAIISRGCEANGDLIGLELMARVLKDGKKVFLALYEPFLTFKSNIEKFGISLDDVLGRNLFILDIFGSFKRIERDIEGVIQIKGYLDDGVFAERFEEIGKKMLETVSPDEDVWFFTYLSSGACKVFSNPLRTVRLVWSEVHDVMETTKNIRIVLLYNSKECPELEEIFYLYADVVVEVFLENGKRRVLVTKGGA
ncbi:hypothetical protein TEU_00715 [Thermococcus eurythermalis]|uniref:KaiC-like domain-containing protein n=2 Tax=Thermococcus eurythermalis TaxID=1505907 RepID=A0A097QR77_9EURY|nr:hypothetical protein TEU_00715 [Thermococcus eurythermalis]